MTTRQRLRSGSFLVLVGLLVLTLLAPAGTVARQTDGGESGESGAGVEGAQATPEVSDPDITPPVVGQPPDLFFAAADAAGAYVEFVPPGAVDDRDGVIAVSCAPLSATWFPLGATQVVCSAWDAAGNQGWTAFWVTVTDQTAPVIVQPEDLVHQGPDGSVVSYSIPTASDNVDGPVSVNCDPASESALTAGMTRVTCFARDAAGNEASVAFVVKVEPPAATTTATTGSGTETPTAGAGTSAEGTPTASPTATRTPPVTPTPRALELPWPPPDVYFPVIDGGPLGGLAAIWRNLEFSITQEYGRTPFSVSHASWYSYGANYGMTGDEHPGLDVSMPAGTWLYSPVDGIVLVAGGTPYYTFYGNGQPGVGELTIQTDDGHQVILGHTGRISVGVGERVTVGMFVGISGGYNGDHLHLETREFRNGSYVMVDPRKSFLIDWTNAGPVEVFAVDGKGIALPGGCFSIYDDAGEGKRGNWVAEACDVWDGEDDGRTTFADVPAGTYILAEWRSPDNYLLARDVAFSRGGSDPTPLELRQGRGGRPVTVKTLDGDSDNLLPGACYQLYEDLGDGKIGDLIAAGCDDHDGRNDGVQWIGGLRAGAYVLHQSQAPKPYQAIRDRPFKLERTDASLTRWTRNHRDLIVLPEATPTKTPEDD